MHKSASGYPPQFDKNPQPGFALSAKAAAGDFSSQDPYGIYSNANEDDQIFTLLQTEAGRTALGA